MNTKTRLALFLTAVTLPIASAGVFGQTVTPQFGGQIHGLETQVTSAAFDQYDPAISGDVIVYTDNRTGIDLDIWYDDLALDQEFAVILAAGSQYLTDVSNGRVVYEDFRTWDIMVFDTYDGTTTNLTNAALSNSSDPATDGTLAVWKDNRNGNWEIYAQNIDTQELRRISNYAGIDEAPAVGNGLIVWQRAASSGAPRDICAYNWATGVTTQITNTPDVDERAPDTDGANIVYYAWPTTGDPDICLFDLAAGTQKQLLLPDLQQRPRISGDFVSFDDYLGIENHIGLWDLATDTVYDVTQGPSAQYYNDIDGNRIVYTDSRNGATDIYMFTFNLPPTANAGPDQLAAHNVLVTLDGSASFDRDKNYDLTCSWEITDKPAGSAAILNNPAAMRPTFTPDMQGDYVITLIVTDALGAQSLPDEVLVSTYNTAPVAQAGPDQAISGAGTLVHLDGTQSYDNEGDSLTWLWTIKQQPEGSAAIVSDQNSPTPTFTADLEGSYVIGLIVTDCFGAESAEDTVTVSFSNVKPVADAGANQDVAAGSTVSISGAASSDADNDPLTYKWSIVSRPASSTAVLGSQTEVTTSFVADTAGDYVISLVVNDGFVDSEPVNVIITAASSRPEPTAALQEALVLIDGLRPRDVKNANLQNTLTNKIDAVLKSINNGSYEDALDKLQHDILQKTDGCATAGKPDKNDSITDCDAQAHVYPAIMDAISALQKMI